MSEQNADFLIPHVLILGFVLPAVISFVLTGAATWIARKHGMLDVPGERHSHQVTTPRGGGAGPVLAIVLMSLLAPPSAFLELWLKFILPGFAALALVGWWDDRVSLSARLRFFVQLAVSLYLIVFLPVASWPAGFVGMAIALLWVVWMTNLYNFMDGSNGMAGLQGLFAGLVLYGLFSLAGDRGASLLGLILAAVCVGFLPWNLGRAKVFMGDAGSLPIGFLIGAFLVYGTLSEAFSLSVAWLLMLVFVMDSSLTLLKRVLKGERWYNPHKQHLYQRLIVKGWSHGRVVLLYQMINLSIVLPGIVVAVNYPAFAMLTAIVLTLAFLLGWLLVMKKLGVLA